MLTEVIFYRRLTRIVSDKRNVGILMARQASFPGFENVCLYEGRLEGRVVLVDPQTKRRTATGHGPTISARSARGANFPYFLGLFHPKTVHHA